MSNGALSQVKFHGEKFDDLIARRGRFVMWEEGILCSCWNQDSQQPLYNCAACHGKGRIFREPVESRVLLTSVAFNTEYEETAGAFQIGDAVMTVSRSMYGRLPSGKWDVTKKEPVPAYNVGMYDIITVMDDEYKSSEVLIKGTPIYGRAADTLINDRVLGIQLVRKVDVYSGEITDYTLDVDYTFINNLIEWIPSGNAPAEGEQYSVTYHHRPSFTVLTTLPKPRYQDGQLLPRYVALRYRAAGFEKQV